MWCVIISLSPKEIAESPSFGHCLCLIKLTSFAEPKRPFYSVKFYSLVIYYRAVMSEY